MGAENILLPLLVILFLGLLIPELVKKVRISYIAVLILVGAILGPHGFNYIETNETINFFGFLGFSFLMLMAGIETQTEHLKKAIKNISILSLINAIFPFILGMILALYFQAPLLTAFIIGIIFISTSVEIVIPLLRNAKIFSSIEGQEMVAAVVIQDVVALLLLSGVLYYVDPPTTLSLPLYFLVLLIAIIGFIIILPKVFSFFAPKKFFKKTKQEETQLRFVIILLISVLLFFSSLGVHPILAAFLVGLIISHIPTSKKIDEKIHTLAYGLFIPVFFIIIGMDFNFKLLTHDNGHIPLVLSVIGIGMVSKYITGYIGGRLTQLSHGYAQIFGVLSMSRLTMTLAATYAASSHGLLDTTWTTAIIALSLVSTIIVPVLLPAVLIKK